MELNITQKKQEPLLSRTMVQASVEFEKCTPSYPEITTSIASNLKTDEKLVVVRHVYTSFGKKTAQVTAYVYADEGKKQFIEPKAKEKKDKKSKEEK